MSSTQPSLLQILKDKSEGNRQRWLTVYTISVTLCGLVVIGLSLLMMHGHYTVGFFLFAGMVVIAELSSVELFVSSRFSTVSVSSIITAACIPLFGPGGAALIMAISGLFTAVSTTFLRRQQPGQNRVSILRRTAFNMAMYSLSAFGGGLAFEKLGGTPDPLLAVSNLLPFLAAVICLNLLNLLLLLIVISIQTGRNPLQIWHQDFQWAVQIAVIGGLIGGGGMGIIYETMGATGAVVTFLPILMMGYSFRMYQSNMKEYVNGLERANNELNEANTGLLETLGAVIDAYDVFTYGHSAQVALYARALACRMQLSTAEQNLIFRAALIHDIGKIGVTEAIIGKQGKLTEAEVQVMRRHPIIGADILRQMKGLQVYILLVRHHHERWDGTGYPAGLAGEEIPLGARVIALADAIEAMSSDRPYRKGRSCAEIQAEVMRCNGKHFDPQVVEALQSILAETGEAFFKNSALTVDQNVMREGITGITNNLRYIKKSFLNSAEPSEISPATLKALLDGETA